MDNITKLIIALEKALLWTDEEHDVGEWRTYARDVLRLVKTKPEKEGR